MLSGSARVLRGTEAPMDVDRNDSDRPSIFAAASASASASASDSSSTQDNSSGKCGTGTSSFSSIFSASTFKFEMPKQVSSPSLKSADSFANFRFTTALESMPPHDSDSAVDVHGQQQGNGTGPSDLSAAPNPDDSFYSDPPTPGLPEDDPCAFSKAKGQPHDHYNADDDDGDGGPSVFDNTPLAGPARVARRLSKGFARRFTASGAAAAAEASAQLDANDLEPSSPTRRIHALHPPRFSSRTITPKNVFTHSDHDHLPPPTSPSSSPDHYRSPPPTVPSSTAHPPPTPGTNNNNNNAQMPPPSSMPRAGAPARPGATPNDGHKAHHTPVRTPGHTPRVGNLNPTLTPRGTPRHKRPRRDYDSDRGAGDYTSGDDDMYDVGDNSVVYVGERFHGYGHQYVPPPPPMQHTPYGYTPHVPMLVHPFYPFATPQGMYGPPPAQPQFGHPGHRGHQQARQQQQRTHMLHSEDEDERGGGGSGNAAYDEGGLDADTSLTHHSAGASSSPGRPRWSSAYQTPYLVQSWVSAIKSLLAFLVTAGVTSAALYLLYQDFDSKRAAITTAMQVEMQACARKFSENHCGATTGRPPMLADACLQWEQCMAKDPFKGVFFGTVVAMFVSETTEAFLGGLSLRTLVFVGLVAAGGLGIMRLSWTCCGGRAKGKGASGRSKSRGHKVDSSEEEDDEDREYAKAKRRHARGAAAAAAESAGSFGMGPMSMGSAPMAIMPPPSSTARPTRYHQQHPSPFHMHGGMATPGGFGPGGAGYYGGGGGGSMASTPGLAGMGIGRMGFGGQQETPSRMPGAGSVRRRRPG